MEQLIKFLLVLRASSIYFRLECWREAVMVVIPDPSKYYEVEFFGDGHVEVQTFGPASEVQTVHSDALERLVAELNAPAGSHQQARE